MALPFYEMPAAYADDVANAINSVVRKTATSLRPVAVFALISMNAEADLNKLRHSRFPTSSIGTSQVNLGALFQYFFLEK